jgi:hypothetical protein
MSYHGEFCNGKYFNSVTGKWVTRLRPSQKSKADIRKWQELGGIKKSLLVPVNTDVELVKVTAVTNSLNFEHLLFVLHKLLYNRLRFRKTNSSEDFWNNYTPLSSKDLYKWLGKNYVQCIQALIDIDYIIPKLTSHGTKSYFNSSGKKSKAVSFKINPSLFNYDLFDHFNFFKSIQLNDVKLTIKLIEKHRINSLSRNPAHALLCKALEGVKVNPSTQILNKNYPHDTVQEMMQLIIKINDKEIYVKPDMDEYGERFHSTFTFAWSALRPLIYFENKEGDTAYLDLKNSQFFFLSLLCLPQTYQLIPEYIDLLPLFQFRKNELHEFNVHCQAGTLYNWCEEVHGLSKLDLMKITFGSSKQFQSKRRKLPWLVEIIRRIEEDHSKNVLPSILQKLESRTMLTKICFEFLSKNKVANLISIHDGVLLEEKYMIEMTNTIQTCFEGLNLPVPTFKTFLYPNSRTERN